MIRKSSNCTPATAQPGKRSWWYNPQLMVLAQYCKGRTGWLPASQIYHTCQSALPCHDGLLLRASSLTLPAPQLCWTSISGALTATINLGVVTLPSFKPPVALERATLLATPRFHARLLNQQQHCSVNRTNACLLSTCAV